MKRMRGWTISLLVVCVFVATGSLEARKVVSMPTVDSVEEALKLMDAFEGEAENFRIAIPEQLFDAAGVNEATIVDHALRRGWTSDGFVQVLSFRVYRFRDISAQPNKLLQPIEQSPAPNFAIGE